MAKKKGKQSVKARAIERNTYESYKRAYNRSKKAMEKKGESMFTRMLTEREFLDTYESYVWDARAEVREGKKKTTGNVILTMVSDQRYEQTKSQAESFYRAAYSYEHEGDMSEYKFNQKILDQVRAGKNETANIFQSFLTEMNEELKRDGMMDSYQRREEIARNWFGSP